MTIRVLRSLKSLSNHLADSLISNVGKVKILTSFVLPLLPVVLDFFFC